MLPGKVLICRAVHVDMFHSEIPRLHGFFNHRNMCLICLKLDICGVWIPVCMCNEGIVSTWIYYCVKNSLKMGFVPVCLTEVSSVVFSTKLGNFYFIQ